MKKFFAPASIAVYGCSLSPGNLGGFILGNLKELGFKGEVYGVGREACHIHGYPVYRSLREIPGRVGLVTIVMPSRTVPDILRDCGALGVKRVAVITSGFNEFGGEGARLSDEMLALAEEYGIVFIGPNCQGIIDFHTGVCLSYGPLKQNQIKKGKISIISQSGSVGWVLSFILSHEIDGLSKVVSIGNKLSVDEIQMAEYLIEDSRTDIILLYLESLSDGRRLCELATQTEKPFIILKSNRGSGSDLALSHTAALASDDRIVDAAFRQAGIVRAQTFSELVDWAKALSGGPLRGPNVIAMSVSGGMALMSEDACQKSDLNLIEIPSEIKDKLWEIGHPKIINYTNPIDLGNVYSYRAILDILRLVLSRDEVDGVILSMFNLGREFHGELEAKEAIALAYEEGKKINKPVAISMITDPGSIYDFKRDADFPIYDSIEDAAESLRKNLKYGSLKFRIRKPTSEKVTCRSIN